MSILNNGNKLTSQGKHLRRVWLAGCIVSIVAAVVFSAPVLAETSGLHITKQPSIIYLPLVVMEQNKLVEKHAKAQGLGDLKMQWVTFNNGGAATDALLSGSVDLVTSGYRIYCWYRSAPRARSTA